MKIREIVNKELFEKLLLLRPAYYDGSVEEGYRDKLFKKIKSLLTPEYKIEFYHHNKKHERIELYFFNKKSGYNSDWIEVYKTQPIHKGEDIDDTEIKFRNNNSGKLPNPIRIRKDLIVNNKPFSIHDIMDEITYNADDDLPF